MTYFIIWYIIGFIGTVAANELLRRNGMFENLPVSPVTNCTLYKMFFAALLGPLVWFTVIIWGPMHLYDYVASKTKPKTCKTLWR